MAASANPDNRVLATLDNQPINLKPGASKIIKASFVIPADLQVGSYVLLADIDPGHAVDTQNTGNNHAASAAPVSLVHQFGTVGSRRNVKLVLTDVQGSTTFTLKGNGTGELTAVGDAFDLVVNGVDVKSSIAVTNKVAGRIARLRDVTINGSLAKFDGKTTDVLHDIHVSGTLGTLALRNTSGGTLTIDGPGALVAFAANDVTDFKINSASAFKSIVVHQWLDADGLRDSVAAPSIAKLQAAGVWQSGLQLSGAAKGATLGAAVIKGAASGVWSVNGDSGGITIGAGASNLAINIAGTLRNLADAGDFEGMLAAKSMLSVDIKGDAAGAMILAGADLGADAKLGGMGEEADTFAAGKIGKFRIRGDAPDVIVAVGLDPINGAIGDGNDSLIGGSIMDLRVDGELNDMSAFLASAFPKVNFGGRKINPATDPHIYTDASRLDRIDAVMEWNRTLIEVLRMGATVHGPTRASRAAAMVQAAVFDAVNSIDKAYTPYLGYVDAPVGASAIAAVASAAHAVLIAIVPDMQTMLDSALVSTLARVPAGSSKTDGVAVGLAAAQQVLNARANDGSAQPVTYTAGSDPGEWRPTTPDFSPPLTPNWGNVTPFALSSAAQFDVPPTPSLDSAAYTDAFNDVKSLGSASSTTRTADQTEAGIFWAYDRPGLGSPVAHYNQIAQEIGIQQRNSLIDNARLFALLNLAQADAGIAAWDVKYDDNFWRPITGIREATTDGNAATLADATWIPLGAPGAGLVPNFTPAFPSYVSGHSALGAATFEVLRDFYGRDDVAFSIASDELPGVTRDFTSFTEAADENGRSRIYLGVHWEFDNAQGETLGESIAQYITSSLMLPTDEVPAVAAQLEADTGPGDTTNSDGITANSAVTGSITGPAPVVTLKAGLDATSIANFIDVTNFLEPGGDFRLSATDMDALAGGSLPDGAHTLRLLALDSMGHSSGISSVAFTLDTTSPRITLVDPEPGSQQVFPFQFITFSFDEPVRLAGNSPVTLSLLGDPVSGHTILDQTGMKIMFVPNDALTGGVQYELSFDPSQVVDAVGHTVSGSGGSLNTSFTTAASSHIPGTSVVGFVYDATPGATGNVPLPGAVVRVANDPSSPSATTDGNGRFEIINVPTGLLLVEVLGQTITSVPAGTFYPTVAERISAAPGQVNTFTTPIFLPLARNSDFTTLSSDTDTQVTNDDQLPGWSLDVPPGSIMRRDGSMATRALIAAVSPDRLPAPLPPNANPSVVITIQTEGGEVFMRPATLTAPNLEGLEPGAKTVLWDFDHARGTFIPTATATVSEDGLTVTTDPGQGVIRPGWHYFQMLFSYTRTVVLNPYPKQLSPEDEGKYKDLLLKLFLSSGAVLGDLSVIPSPISPIAAVLGTAASIARASMNSNTATAGEVAKAVTNTTLANDSTNAINQAKIALRSADGSLESAAIFLKDAEAQANAGNPNLAKNAFERVDNALKGALDANGRAASALRRSPLSKLASKAIGPLSLIPDILQAYSDATALYELYRDPPGDLISRTQSALLDGIIAMTRLVIDLVEAQRALIKAELKVFDIHEIAGSLPDDHVLTTGEKSQLGPLLDGIIADTNRILRLESRDIPDDARQAKTKLELVQSLVSRTPGDVVYRFTSGSRSFTGTAVGELSFTLERGESGTLVVADPVTGAIGREIIVAPAGVSFATAMVNRGSIALLPSQASDANGNGLPDDIDAVFVTPPSSATVRDLLAGVDPVAAGLPLIGTLGRSRADAIDVAAGPGVAYVARGNGGLGVIDLSRPTSPNLIRRTGTEGPALRVFALGQRVAVTESFGVVEVFDASVQGNPVRIARVSGANTGARAVLDPNHIIFAKDDTLVASSIGLSAQTDTLVLPGSGVVADLYLVGGVIYALRNDTAAQTFTLASAALDDDGQLTLLGSHTFHGRSGFGTPTLSGGDGVLYLSSVVTEEPSLGSVGYATIDISNPASPHIIGDASTDQFVRALAVDGAGNGFALQFVNNTTNSAALFDVSNPAVTNDHVQTFNLTDVSAIAIQGAFGLAVANGDLFVVRYIAPDTGNSAPTAAITMPADQTIVTEGTHVPVHVRATDDHQIASVELVMQGDNVLARDTSYPFDLDLHVPFDLPDNQPLTLTARVTDSGGNVTTSTIQLNYRAALPVVVGATPAPGSSSTARTQSIRLDFNKPINVTTAMVSDFTVIGAGIDRTLGTTDDIAVPVDSFSTTADRLHLTLALADELDPQQYRVTVSATHLLDTLGATLDGEFSGAFPTGNGVAGGNFSYDFTVRAPAGPIYPAESFNTTVAAPGPTITVDLTGDGRLDVITADHNNEQLAINLNNGDGSLAAATFLPLVARPFGLAAGDINGDGLDDVFAFVAEVSSFGAPTSNMQVSISLSNGDGTFASESVVDTGVPATNTVAFARPSGVVSDFNGDGDNDLALWFPSYFNESSNTNVNGTVHFYYGNDTGTLTAGPIIDLEGFAGGSFTDYGSHILAADLNRDDRPDLVTREAILLSTGSGNFTVNRDFIDTQQFSGQFTTQAIAVGDFDGDSIPDLIGTSPNAATIGYRLAFARGVGDGTFNAISLDLQIPNRLPTASIKALDFNGDGALDIIGADEPVYQNFLPLGQAGAFVLLGNGDGGFAAPIISDVGQPGQSTSINAADINSDGRLDILIGYSRGFPVQGYVTAMKQNANGSLESLGRLHSSSGGTSATTFAVGDINGDGRPDVIAAGAVESNSPNDVSVHLGNGAGIQPPVGVDVIPNASVRPSFVYLHDLNDDNKLDLILGGLAVSEQDFVIALGNGNGTFQPPITKNFPFAIGAADFADFNGDGKVDIIVADDGGFHRGLSVLPGNGDGTFGDEIFTNSFNDFGRNLVIGDFNGDNKIDAAISDLGFNAATIYVYTNDGTGAFTRTAVKNVQPPNGNNSISPFMAAGDVDRDGKIDIIASGAFFLHGNGDGTFADGQHLFNGNRITSLTLADVNADSLLDIIAIEGGDIAVISTGNGDGTFEVPRRFNASSITGGIAVADLNGDGKPDIIVGGGFFDFTTMLHV